MFISNKDAIKIANYAKENLTDSEQIKNLSWSERKLLHRALIIINSSRDVSKTILSDKKVIRVFQRIKVKKDQNIKPLKNIILRYIKVIANRYFGRISSSKLLKEINKVKIKPEFDSRTCVFKDGKIVAVKDGIDEEISEGEIRVKIFLGDLLKQENVCAIINPANENLRGGGGVDGLIGNAAGKSIYKECKKQLKEKEKKKGETGEAYITGSGDLQEKKNIKHVIHTIGPFGSDDNRKALLRDAYYNSLLRAHENNLESIAFPAISIGVFKYPPEEAAQVAFEAIKEFIEKYPETTLKDVRLVYFAGTDADVTSYNACHTHLDKLFIQEET